MHLTEPLDIPGCSVFVKRSKPRGVRVVRSEELAAGVEPAALDVSVAPNVHPGSSFLPYVRLRSSAAKRGQQDAGDLDVHPRVIMRILRHADQAVTMEIYANAKLGGHT